MRNCGRNKILKCFFFLLPLSTQSLIFVAAGLSKEYTQNMCKNNIQMKTAPNTQNGSLLGKTVFLVVHTQKGLLCICKYKSLSK